MSGLVEKIKDGYHFMLHELPSPVTKDWFLVGRPYQIISILVVYLIFSTRLGPWYMRNKKSYDLKTVIKYYNLFQILACLYLFYQGMDYLLAKEFSILCQAVDDPKSQRAYNIASAAWYYFIIKVIDLLDTVFFVLRKSDRQITSLHLHHHTLMPIASWIGMTYFPGGQAALMATLNSLVHAVMYTYYYLAGLGDNYKKYLWWKRHVTEMQLIQFVIVGLHALNSLFYECGYPTWIKIGMIMYAGIFINMFGQFYYNCYIVKKHQKTEKVTNGTEKISKENHENGGEANGKSNGFKNEKASNGETVTSVYKNGKDAQAKISNGLSSHLKTH
ncbi:elongation of very long chain fatty acids protein 7 [Bicyclus anynana]|uniref:Elongation of very long chain fatty acids protein n=1 Tax=Bicyclus anynana TaxID=110368 RepID=A0ABM3LHE8_BICAN|nr:elongation of very long chain fatty acids protein 7 [Bicyclus anynana]